MVRPPAVFVTVNEIKLQKNLLDRLSIAYTVQQLMFAAKIASMERG